ncbi:MAG: 16S rRNA (guanine(966)-N(2))-methyltransferase RsmD [Phycisphaerales bacterium]
MRIIAGEYRGRRLVGPADAETTRPITDRVKQALFDRLAAAGRLEGAVVLDLFSGTGSMGLECLSRGAKHVTFVERDRDARQRLEENLRTLGAMDRATVMGSDALGMGLIAAAPGRWGPVGLIFVDPPYRMMQGPEREKVEKQMTRLAEVTGEAEACLVLRVEKHTAMSAVEGWNEPMIYTYGSMKVCFYVRHPAC